MRWAGVVLTAVLVTMAAAARAQETSPPAESPPPEARADTYSGPEAAPEGTSKEEAARDEVGEIVALTKLTKGDHVNLLMKSGQNFEGHVAALGPETITLDFTFSRQQVAGVVTFPKAEVAVVMRLPPLSKEEKETRLDRRRQRVRKARERWTMVASTELVGKPEALKLTPEQKEERRRAEEERQIEQYRALLREFPPQEGWGPERLAQIRRRHFILGMPVTYPEWRFWQIFDEWSEARTLVELYDQRRKQEQQMLLTFFPPEEGWGPAVKKQLEEKKTSGKELTKLEAQFLKDYQRWQAAVAARAQAERQPAPPPPSPSPPTQSAP